MRLEEGNPAWHADKERSKELEACKRGKGHGPGIEDCVVKVTAEINTEGSEIRVK
jgi:hypothetical protein